MKSTNFDQLSRLLYKNCIIKSIYDIGENKVALTKKYSEFIPKADFFMFEASPSMIKPNLSYDWFNIVLSDKDKKEVIFHEINGTGDSYYEEKTSFYSGRQKRHKLLTRTLDSVIYEYKLPCPDIIKVDTQSSEVDIFKGGHNALQSCKLLLT